MPPLSVGPIINQLKESIEQPRDAESLKNTFRRIIEAFEEVETAVNENYNNPQNLNYGFLTHRLERPEDLANYLRLVAGTGITLTPNTALHTETIAATATASPLYIEEFPPVQFDDVLTGTLYGQWHWYVLAGAASSIGATQPGATAAADAAIGILSLVRNQGGSVQLRPIYQFGPNWFMARDNFDATIRMSIDIDAADGDETTRFGFTGVAAGGLPPANGIYFENLNNEANWFGVCRAGGAQTRVNTNVARGDDDLTAVFVNFRVRRVNATTIGFTVGAGAEVTNTLTIPTTGLDPWIALDAPVGVGNIGTYWDRFRISFPLAYL